MSFFDKLKRRNVIVLAIGFIPALVLASSYFAFDKFVLDPERDQSNLAAKGSTT